MLTDLLKEECNVTKATYFQSWFNAFRRKSDSAKAFLEHYGHRHGKGERNDYRYYLLKTLNITTYCIYCTVYIFDRFFTMYIFYYDVHPKINLLFLDYQSYHMYLIPNFWWFLSISHSNFPSVNLGFGFCGIGLNLYENFGPSIDTHVFAVDIGPSSLCLIPGLIRYNSVLLFVFLTSQSNYAERECTSAVLC